MPGNTPDLLPRLIWSILPLAPEILNAGCAGHIQPGKDGQVCTCSGMVKGPPSSTRMRWLWVLSYVKRYWAQTDPKDPPPKIITSNMRAFGLRDESVLAKASSRPLQTYRPRTSLLKGVYCAVAGVGITIYSLRRSWGKILDSGLTASRAYRAMWSATNAPAGRAAGVSSRFGNQYGICS